MIWTCQLWCDYQARQSGSLALAARLSECKSVLAGSRDLSWLTDAGILLSFYLPVPNLMAVAFWHILVGFLWKCPSAEAVWTEEYPTGQPFLLAFAFWVEGTAFGIKLSTFIQGVFCPRPLIKPFLFSWFIADLELFSLWVYVRVPPFKEFLQQCRCNEFERAARSWWVSRSEKQVPFSTDVPSFQCRVYYLCPNTRFSNRVNWGYNCLC